MEGYYSSGFLRTNMREWGRDVKWGSRSCQIWYLPGAEPVDPITREIILREREYEDGRWMEVHEKRVQWQDILLN
jgi:hypothetical protein